MPPLERYARRVVGPCQVVRRHRTSGPKRVLEVRDADGVHWFAKRMHLRRLWRGELAGYSWWQEHPATPRLRHRNRALRALVVSAVPGTPASPEDHAAFEAAGALLRELHEVRTPVADDSWLARARQSAHFETGRADRAGVRVDPGPVERALEAMAQLAAEEELVCRPSHGDFLPHNWLVGRSGAVATLDFAEAGLRPVTHDLARLRLGPCWQRSDLWSAFLGGYGRELSEVEHRLMGHQLAVNAVVAVGWGTTHSRADVRDRGLQALERIDPRTGQVDPPGRSGSRRRDRWRASARRLLT